MSTPSQTSPGTIVRDRPHQAALMLTLATVGFAVSFWAWALISPLGPTMAKELDLSGFQLSLLVAVPVLVGSLGRIPAGALTDRYGARLMFPALTALTIIPVLFVGLVAHSFALLLLGGFFLGLGGTTFAVGVPFVNAWFPPERRGTAIGIFGAGTIGTAISAFSTVQIAKAWGRPAPFLIVAVALALFAVVGWRLLRDARPPARSAPASGSATLSASAKVWATLKRPVTLQLSLLYALAFGGFVAFSVYLPTYLINAYQLEVGAAALRTAGFVVVAVAIRPVGGWLADRYGPPPVLVACFIGAGLCAVLAALRLQLLPAGTVAFLLLAAFLGAASGATFALVARLVDPADVGSVTGVVGAAGGLGGFVPPLVMGIIYDLNHHYFLGLMLLAIASFGVAFYTWRTFARTSMLSRSDADAPGTTTEGTVR